MRHRARAGRESTKPPEREIRIINDIEANRRHLERIQALSPAERTEFHQRLRQEERARRINVVIFVVVGVLVCLVIAWTAFEDTFAAPAWVYGLWRTD